MNRYARPPEYQRVIQLLSKIDKNFWTDVRLSQVNQIRSSLKAIPMKYIELIFFAVGLATGVDHTARAHARFALEEGATKEELAEAMRIAYVQSSINVLLTASKAFESIKIKETREQRSKSLLLNKRKIKRK